MRPNPGSIDEFFQHELDLYREAHRDASWSRGDFLEQVFDKFENEVSSGVVKLDLRTIAKNAAYRADRLLLGEGKRFIERLKRDLATGQASLDEYPGWKDVCVPLGKGERIRYGAVRIREYQLIADLKEDNFKRVKSKRERDRLEEQFLIPMLLEGFSIEDLFNAKKLHDVPDLYGDGDLES